MNVPNGHISFDKYVLHDLAARLQKIKQKIGVVPKSVTHANNCAIFQDRYFRGIGNGIYDWIIAKFCFMTSKCSTGMDLKLVRAEETKDEIKSWH